MKPLPAIAHQATKEGDRLFEVRELLGLSQREIAAELHVSPGTIALWETGQRPMAGPVLKLLAMYEEELGIASPVRSTRAASIFPPGYLARNARAAPSTLLWHTLRWAFADESTNGIARFARRAILKRYVKALGELKGLMMKIGQMQSYMMVTLPEEDAKVLSSLPDQSPALPAADVACIIKQELGAAPRQLFKRWDSQPTCASIGQVHRAELPSGERVAVKVQYPKIADALRADLINVEVLEKLYCAVFRGQEPGVYFPAFAAAILGELDYRQEAENQRAYAHLFQDHPVIRVPAVHPTLCTERVLTTSWDDGVSLQVFAAEASQEERNAAARAVWQFYFVPLLEHAMCNTDPQPGNILFGTRTVTFLDFGRVQRFSPGYQECMRRMMRALAERNKTLVRDVSAELGMLRTPQNIDIDAWYRLNVCMNRGWLSESPYRLDAAQLRQCWRVLWAENPNKSYLNYTKDQIFLDQIYFGVGAILARLDATVDYRTTMLDMLYGPGVTHPRPFTAAEFRQLML